MRDYDLQLLDSLTTDQHQRVIDLLLGGLTPDEAAKITGFPLWLIFRCCNYSKRGKPVAMPPYRPRYTQLLEFGADQVIKLSKQGLVHKEIANRVGSNFTARQLADEMRDLTGAQRLPELRNYEQIIDPPGCRDGLVLPDPNLPLALQGVADGRVSFSKAAQEIGYSEERFEQLMQSYGLRRPTSSFAPEERLNKVPWRQLIGQIRKGATLEDIAAVEGVDAEDLAELLRHRLGQDYFEQFMAQAQGSAARPALTLSSKLQLLRLVADGKEELQKAARLIGASQREIKATLAGLRLLGRPDPRGCSNGEGVEEDRASAQ